MGRASIAIRGTDGCPGVLDGSGSREFFCEQKQTAGFCIGPGRVGQALSDSPRAFTWSQGDDLHQGPQDEVALHQLWFRLSAEDRARFGGCFSRMVLKALGRKTRQEGRSES